MGLKRNQMGDGGVVEEGGSVGKSNLAGLAKERFGVTGRRTKAAQGGLEERGRD